MFRLRYFPRRSASPESNWRVMANSTVFVATLTTLDKPVLSQCIATQWWVSLADHEMLRLSLNRDFHWCLHSTVQSVPHKQRRNPSATRVRQKCVTSLPTSGNTVFSCVLQHFVRWMYVVNWRTHCVGGDLGSSYHAAASVHIITFKKFHFSQA